MGLTFEFIHNGEVLATSNEISQVSATANTDIIGNIIIAENGNEKFIKEIKNAIYELINKSETSRKLLNVIFDKLKEQEKGIIIYPNTTNPYLLGFNINIKQYKPTEGRGPRTNPLDTPISATLAHELEHIRQHLLDEVDMAQHCTDRIPEDGEEFETIEYCEVLAVEVENSVRKELNSKLEFRTYYGNIKVYNDTGNKYNTLGGKFWGETKGPLYKYTKISDDTYKSKYSFSSESLSTIPREVKSLKNTDKPNVTFSTTSLIKIRDDDSIMKKKIERGTGKNKIIIIEGKKINIIKRI